ncbi:putative oxidoreductase C-terminal domain-containing protein [bacterium]
MCRTRVSPVIIILIFILFYGCSKKHGKTFTGTAGEVKLMTLDPGHFHAALVQKVMYPQVNPVVHVYGSMGPDIQDHLRRIGNFNRRDEKPTQWNTVLYTEDDFFENMLQEQPGNVVILSGNNRRKTEYIKACVNGGLHVLSDKPMCIDQAGFNLLKSAFEKARKNNVLLYDIMTERYEITTILQKTLSRITGVFGTLQQGTPENPAVVKESVHHFFKYVSGNPIKRPAWYFDTDQQGEGLVDVTTHLVDLIQWQCFPGETIKYQSDIRILKARHWPTLFSKDQFKKVTRLPEFPHYLRANLQEGLLPVFCNGDMIYRIKDVHAKVSVIWNFQAEKGGGDTHFSIMRGTQSHLIIRQGKEQQYRPELYVELEQDKERKVVQDALAKAMVSIQETYPGVDLESQSEGWHIIIPDKYRIGHEAHFGQVTEKYLGYLVEGKLPEWEVPNMIAKYYTTTIALEVARQTNSE